MGSPTLDAVNQALHDVEDPIFRKRLGELGTLLDARIENGRVWAKVRLSSPSEEARQTISAARTMSMPIRKPRRGNLSANEPTSGATPT